ncbi:hypothetical protein DQ04_07451030 [Trypanosoma grayi]|uniref:hypothetical protein n=1 Tax=Trypanosoma grayi TaxID=71804 RepID=UPI0004F46A4A|nr:hypothetical protein DQ04_07451030 [Trypanosoma grayi]KEG08324.1 hypothetical protein DQ04_07451030 [Trypanosoma grayi]
MVRLHAEMEEKGTQVVQEWRRLQQERQQLIAEKDALRDDEAQLRQTGQCLQMLKGQLEATRSEAATAQDHTRALQHELRVSHDAVEKLREPHAESNLRTSVAAPPQRSAVPRVSQNANRLPLRVLTELRHMLGKDRKQQEQLHATVESTMRRPHDPMTGITYASATTAPNLSASLHDRSLGRKDPRQQKQRKPQENRFVDPCDASRDTSAHLYDSSNNNFTCLLAFSDTESLHQSLQSSA